MYYGLDDKGTQHFVTVLSPDSYLPSDEAVSKLPDTLKTRTKFKHFTDALKADKQHAVHTYLLKAIQTLKTVESPPSVDGIPPSGRLRAPALATACIAR